MNIVLVCLNNFQEYILQNIEQLIHLGHESIYVITNSSFFHHFNDFYDKITLINSDELEDSYHHFDNSTIDKTFRNGFWTLTSSRFFYIYAFMVKFSVQNIIHLENDVLLYYNCNTIMKYFENSIYLPFDSFTRNIASIMYIPNAELFKTVLDHYDFTMNDMSNFHFIKQKTGLIKPLPIFIKKDDLTEEQKFVSENDFPFIFDAAAIGQYLGGVDPRNQGGDTRGFVNETCVIKYNQYEIWMDDKPFILVDGKVVPIFNLHIHSKQLKQFMCKQFDIVIPVGPNEKDIIESQINYTKKNIIGYRNIYLVCYDPSIKVHGCTTIDERIFPFTMETVIEHHGKHSKNGWYLQQLLKLYAGTTIPNILKKYLVIDSDTFFLKPTTFIEKNKCLFNFDSQYVEPYFAHMLRLDNTFKKMQNVSGICHHMMFETKYVNEMIQRVEKNHQDIFYTIFLKMVTDITYGASEYELYFNYMLQYHNDKIKIRELKFRNANEIVEDPNFDYLSYHWYCRN